MAKSAAFGIYLLGCLTLTIPRVDTSPPNGECFFTTPGLQAEVCVYV